MFSIVHFGITVPLLIFSVAQLCKSDNLSAESGRNEAQVNDEYSYDSITVWCKQIQKPSGNIRSNWPVSSSWWYKSFIHYFKQLHQACITTDSYKFDFSIWFCKLDWLKLNLPFRNSNDDGVAEQHQSQIPFLQLFLLELILFFLHWEYWCKFNMRKGKIVKSLEEILLCRDAANAFPHSLFWFGESIC